MTARRSLSTIEPPNEADRQRARSLVDFFDNLSALATFAGDDDHQARVNFAAMCFRNCRLGFDP